MPNTNELAKETLITLKKKGLKPTPENYAEIFEELSQKYGILTNNKMKIEKYQSLLLSNYQKELKNKRIKTLEELISFLIARLNAQSGKQFMEFYKLFKTSLQALELSRDKKIKELAKTTLSRISRTIDSENIFLLEKKWKELQKEYENFKLDKKLLKYGIANHEDFDLVIKKLLEELNFRSYEYFANLLISCLNPSLVEDLKIQGFAQNLKEKPSLIGEEKFKNELLFYVNKRINADNLYIQKNLSFFDENLKKIDKLLSVLDSFNQGNLNFISMLEKDENGEIKLSFEDLKDRFSVLDEKIKDLNHQLDFVQNSQERETWSMIKELEILDLNFTKYKINYALTIFSVQNYRFIMEKYGLGSLNEIFVRFKKILKESCTEFDELWMIDEKSYIIMSAGKSKEEVESLVKLNLQSIENFRFIYKQDIITPKIKAIYLDKESNPNINIFEELLRKIKSNE